jgi:hypothetical protein
VRLGLPLSLAREMEEEWCEGRANGKLFARPILLLKEA